MLSKVVVLLSPEESIQKLKLWSVNRNFKTALDNVAEALLADAEEEVGDLSA